MGVGECAGEVVSAVDFDLGAAEREVFEAQLALEEGNAGQAGRKSLKAMLQAAKALVKIYVPTVPDDPDEIVSEFRSRFYDTQLFFDPFAGGKFANYLFDAHKKSQQPHTPETAGYLINEAQLFIDAAHTCNNQLATHTKTELQLGTK
jgi:sulfite reductase (ferredoxin)